VCAIQLGDIEMVINSLMT